MKKTNLLLLILLAGVLVFNISCLSTLNATEKDPLTVEYETLNKKFQEKMKTVNSRESYNAALTERTKDMEAFLKKVEANAPGDSQVLLSGKVLLELRKQDEALQKADTLITKKSPLINEAKFLKTKILLQKEKIKEATALFAEIENKLEKTQEYLELMFMIAYSTEDNAVKMAYAKKFITLAGDKPELSPYRAQMYQEMATIEKDSGNMKKAIETLEKGLVGLTDPQSKRQLEGALTQLKMIDNPAIEINSETWYNSSPLKLADLKGKVVVIDFWATWCNPCRMVIPTLVKCYNEYKDKGLVVIGFTHVQGRYSDEKENKGKIPAEEEKKLTQEFLKRWNITYPIAMADTRATTENYGISGIPTMIFIDKKGNVKEVQVGVESEEALIGKIKKLLEQK